MRNNTVQYMSSNNIQKIKFCLVVELTSEGSVRLWALWQSSMTLLTDAECYVCISVSVSITL